MLSLLLMMVPGEDHEQFTAMYYQYRNLVNHIVYNNLKHREDTDDCFQDIFEHFTRHFDEMKLKDEETLKGYICLVAKNMSISFYRRRQGIENKTFGYIDNMTEHVRDDSFDIYNKIDVENAMAKLTDEEENIIQMKCVYGMSSKEIGNVLGITDVNARKRFERAKKKLMKYLNNE